MKLIITMAALLFTGIAFGQTQAAKATEQSPSPKEEKKLQAPAPSTRPIQEQEKPVIPAVTKTMAEKTATPPQHAPASSQEIKQVPAEQIKKEESKKAVEKEIYSKPRASSSTLPKTMERKTPAGVVQTEKEKQGQQLINQ